MPKLQQQSPHGWHTLDIESKGVVPAGVGRMLVGKRVGVGLTQSTMRLLLPSLSPRKEASASWYSELSLHQLGSQPASFTPRRPTHSCILCQECAARGAVVCVGTLRDFFENRRVRVDTAVRLDVEC